MPSYNARERIIARAAREIRAGMTVNLGIGLPTQVVRHLDADLPVCLHSENGIAGVGPALATEEADRNLIDAGGAYVSTLPGASFFDSAVSFALVRGGRLDLALLGALEVSANGDLANWIVPGHFAPGVGGGMELAQKSRRVVALTMHCDKAGRPKIVDACTLPLTAPGCVDRVITDMAVVDVTVDGMVLKEIAEGVAVRDVVKATGTALTIDEARLKTY
jgi:3-oxoacid CoA-transferase subunit B